MEIGVYLCLSSAIYLLGLLFLARPSKKLVIYTLISLILGSAGLAAYLGFAHWIGVLQFGRAASFSYPQDYLKQGVPGLATCLLLPLWMLSPLLVAFLIARRYAAKA